MKIICKFRKSHPELLYKKADLKCLKNFRETLMMGSCFNKIAKWRCVTLLKVYSTTLVILGVFQNLQNSHYVTYTATSVIGLCLLYCCCDWSIILLYCPNSFPFKSSWFSRSLSTTCYKLNYALLLFCLTAFTLF